MPRLIKASLAPGKYRASVEAGRRTGPIRKPGKDATQTVAEIMQLTGAVMEHPVTDLIVRGISEVVTSGKEDVAGYKELAQKRAEHLRRRAAEARTPARPMAPPPRPETLDLSGVSRKGTLGAMLKQAKDYTGQLAASRRDQQAPPPTAPPTAPPAAPTAAPTMGGAPREIEDILAFVSSPLTTEEDLDWALKQVARFTPVTSLSEIGKPQLKYVEAVLNAYAVGTKRTPTGLDLRKHALKERKEQRKVEADEFGRTQEPYKLIERISTTLLKEQGKGRRALLRVSKEGSGKQQKEALDRLVVLDLATDYKALVALKEKIEGGEGLDTKDLNIAQKASQLINNLKGLTPRPSFSPTGFNKPYLSKYWKELVEQPAIYPGIPGDVREALKTIQYLKTNYGTTQKEQTRVKRGGERDEKTRKSNLTAADLAYKKAIGDRDLALKGFTDLDGRITHAWIQEDDVGGYKVKKAAQGKKRKAAQKLIYAYDKAEGAVDNALRKVDRYKLKK